MELDLSFILGNDETEKEAAPGAQQAPGLAKEKTKEQAEQAEALRICQENQRRSARTGQLQAEILKGLKQGEDTTSLFLKAMEALSLAVNNPLIFTQASQDIATIYGKGLRQPKPLEMEIAAVKGRLRTLQQAAIEAENTEDRERIQGAIKSHRENLERLQKQLNSTAISA